MSATVHAKKRRTYRQVYEEEETLPGLIGPEEVDETADSWDEVDEDMLNEEVVQCLDIISSERHHEGAIRDLAITLWAESFPRVKMEDLVFDTVEEAMANDYHPYSVSRHEVEEHLWERDEPVPSGPWSEARSTVMAAAGDKMDPRKEKGDSR